MFNLDAITDENNKDHNKKWPYKMLIIAPSGSGKTNALLNVIGMIYLCAKDLGEPTYKLLIKKREDPGIKNVNNPSAFIDHSNTMDDVRNNIDNYNPKKEEQNFNCL